MVQCWSCPVSSFYNQAMNLCSTGHPISPCYNHANCSLLEPCQVFFTRTMTTVLYKNHANCSLQEPCQLFFTSHWYFNITIYTYACVNNKNCHGCALTMMSSQLWSEWMRFYDGVKYQVCFFVVRCCFHYGIHKISVVYQEI